MTILDFVAGLFNLLLFPVYYSDNVLIVSAVSFIYLALISALLRSFVGSV